jgi:hypothetical protein
VHNEVAVNRTEPASKIAITWITMITMHLGVRPGVLGARLAGLSLVKFRLALGFVCTLLQGAGKKK